MIDISDITQWSENDLNEASRIIEKEKQRRYTVKTAENQMDNLLWQYSDAMGREAGDVWKAPTGAHDSYPSGQIVSHEGKSWVSLIPGNVWEPGVSGWREYVEPESGIVPEYVQPSGAHDSYRVGDRITFRGTIYEAVQDSLVHSPAEYPQGWAAIDENVIPGPGGEDPSEIIEFVQPTGAHDAYMLGDRVLFDGEIFESLENNNVYSPVDYPAGWAHVPAEGSTPEPEPEPEPAVPAAPEFSQPSGEHDAYQVGDQVTYNGEVYESVIANNVYSPDAYPAGWKRVW